MEPGASGAPSSSVICLIFSRFPMLTCASTIQNLKTSLLLKLPPEIRVKIFRLLYSPRSVGVCYRNGDRVDTSFLRKSDGIGSAIPTAFQLTCRHIFQDYQLAELSLIPYMNSTFTFEDFEVMKTWLQGLKPAQKRAVRTLILPYKLQPEVLESLTGLQKAYIIRPRFRACEKLSRREKRDWWNDSFDHIKKEWASRGLTLKVLTRVRGVSNRSTNPNSSSHCSRIRVYTTVCPNRHRSR